MIKLDFSKAMASSTHLLNNAENILKKKLISDPDNATILWQLGQIKRQKGELKNAIEYYKKLLIIKPDHKESAYLISVFEGKKINKYSFDCAYPAPFIAVNNFLDNKEQLIIWKHIRKNKNNFIKSMIDGGRLRPEYRKSNILPEENLNEIKLWFLEKLYIALSGKLENLLMKPLQIRHTEIELNIHGHGDYYKIHKDSGDNGEIKNRKITFVYYFYKMPKKYTGGDLLLFDTNPKKNVYIDKFTRIIPLNNSVIFFPSYFFHQITPVNCFSDNIENLRFTINGWLYSN